MKSSKSILFMFFFFLFAAGARAEGKNLSLTFNRTGNDVNSVAVSVGGEGLPDGITATLVSTSFDELKSTGADAITNGSVLAPNAYANDEGAEISYLFCIEGLPSDFTYNAVEVDVFALTAKGTAQSNTGNTVRYFQFQASVGPTSQVSLFAEKAVDTDICTVPDQKNGLYHSSQVMKVSNAVSATNPLYLQVTLIKKSALGCYAGIGMVRLYTEGGDDDPTVDDKKFSADKFYTIHRNNNTSAYIYQDGTHMGAGALSAERRFWWTLEPTGKEDCYYIKNATTGDYVQSSNQELSSLVPMGKEPVEFQIKMDETSGASTAGFYYMASTDQEISVATDGTLGLNFGATGIVAYYIRTGRGNSYWQIEESEYAYEPTTVVATDYARSIQLYSIPCGSLGTAYLDKVDVEGDDVLSPLHYAADNAPATPHVLFTAEKIAVRQGGKLPLNIKIENDGASIRSFAYADWDKDGVFEQSTEFSEGKAVFSLPGDVSTGQYRLRIRVTETNTTEAEDDVIGVCYDFIVQVVDAESVLTWSVESNDENRGTATGTEKDGVLQLKAEPKGNATFVGWKLMNGYFMGNIVATNAEMEYPLTQSVRLVAVFSPNTQEIIDGIGGIANSKVIGQSTELYDLSGRRIPLPCPQGLKKGVYIINGKKLITK